MKSVFTAILLLSTMAMAQEAAVVCPDCLFRLGDKRDVVVRLKAKNSPMIEKISRYSEAIGKCQVYVNQRDFRKPKNSIAGQTFTTDTYYGNPPEIRIERNGTVRDGYRDVGPIQTSIELTNVDEENNQSRLSIYCDELITVSEFKKTLEKDFEVLITTDKK